MYIKVDENKITNEQLQAISEILGNPRLDVVMNVHYEACRFEIECAIENMLEAKEYEEFKASEEYEDKIERWTSMLYYSSDYSWECLYEKASEIIEL